MPGSSFNMFNFPGGQALCTVEGRRYIRFLVDDHAVHELDRELEVVRSFEAVEAGGDVPFGSLLREVRSRGAYYASTRPP